MAEVERQGGAVGAVSVVGARGGAGTSTVAAAVASRVSRRTATVLVDADPASAGIDLLVGLERSGGVRWPDLAGARGDVPGADLLVALPRWGACAVLSAARDGVAPEHEVVADVVRALALVAGLVVVDRGRGLSGVAERVLVVTPRDLRAVTRSAAVVGLCAGLGLERSVVARGPAPGGMAVAELAHAVGAPVTASVPTVRGLAAAAERGGLPVRGVLARSADRIVDRLGLGPR